MKVTVIPAQITTVEDRIAGSLSMSQLILLALPIFGGTGLYIVLPPFMHNALYKLIILLTFAFICCVLAIRIKGRLVFQWLLVLTRYSLRPRYYVFDKNSQFARQEYEIKTDEELEKKVLKTTKQYEKPIITNAQTIDLQQMLDNPATKLAFITKKGGLYVRVTEVQK